MINFLLGNKTALLGIALIVTIIGMGTYVKILKRNIELCEKEKVVLTEKLAISQDAVIRLTTAIDEQNKAVEKFRADAAEREKRNASELNRVRITADTNKKRAEEILARKPPPDVPDYKAADDLINEAIRNAKSK